MEKIYMIINKYEDRFFRDTKDEIIKIWNDTSHSDTFDDYQIYEFTNTKLETYNKINPSYVLVDTDEETHERK